MNIFVKLVEGSRGKVDLSGVIKYYLLEIRLFSDRKNVILIFLEDIIEVITSNTQAAVLVVAIHFAIVNLEIIRLRTIR